MDEASKPEDRKHRRRARKHAVETVNRNQLAAFLDKLHEDGGRWLA